MTEKGEDGLKQKPPIGRFYKVDLGYVLMN